MNYDRDLPLLLSFMSIAALRTELRALNKSVRNADSSYRMGDARMSDIEFDDLDRLRRLVADQLRKSAPHAPELEEDESIVLLSLDNKPFEQWVEGFDEGTIFTVQPKIDGCSLAVRYEDGVLVAASKRCGSDVLGVARKVEGIPATINEPGVFEVHGELHGWDENSQKRSAKALNASGTTSGLHFTAYRVVDATGQELATLQHLRGLGFDVPDTLTCSDPRDVRSLHAEWILGRVFDRFPTDGIVVKVLEHSLQRELGQSTGAKPCPHWALAMKHYA